jgi:hypothetical protein
VEHKIAFNRLEWTGTIKFRCLSFKIPMDEELVALLRVYYEYLIIGAPVRMTHFCRGGAEDRAETTRSMF